MPSSWKANRLFNQEWKYYWVKGKLHLSANLNAQSAAHVAPNHCPHSGFPVGQVCPTQGLYTGSGLSQRRLPSSGVNVNMASFRPSLTTSAPLRPGKVPSGYTIPAHSSPRQLNNYLHILHFNICVFWTFQKLDSMIVVVINFVVFAQYSA